MADTYKAQIDGFDLVMENIEDDITKSIAKYEFPYRDGAFLEDMGQKARGTKYRCYFWDDTYLDHIEFLKHLSDQSLFEFIHPKYGLMKGCIETVAVNQDERQNTAIIDVVFWENLRGDIEPQVYEDVQAASEESFIQGQSDMTDDYANDIQICLGAEATYICGVDLDPSRDLLSQYKGLSPNGTAYVQQVQVYVNALQRTLTGIVNPSNSLIGTINYDTNLPGLVIGMIARALERSTMLFASIATAPTLFIGNVISSFNNLGNKFQPGSSLSRSYPADQIYKSVSASFSKQITTEAAFTLAVEAATIYKADEEQRLLYNSVVKTQSFDALGNYRNPDPLPTIMSVNDLEGTLGAVRSYIQAAVDQNRQMESLKTTALVLLNHVNVIKIQREKIVQVTIDNPLPLHLILLANGIPYNEADHIMSINNITNPNFTRGAVNVYAR